MTYILQTIEIKQAPQKLIDLVKKLGKEKHDRMEKRREMHKDGQFDFSEVIHV
mgnify:CR=1 FL=1